MAMKATLYSINGLAAELKRDRRTIARALSDVSPDGKLNGRDAWYIVTAQNALDPDTEGLNPVREKARLDAAKADIAEIELATLRGDRIPADEVRELLDRVASVVRTNILAIPSKVAPLLHGKLTEAEREQLLSREIDEVLEALSSLKLKNGKKPPDDSSA